MGTASTRQGNSISFQRGWTPKRVPYGHTYDMTLSRSLSAIGNQVSLVKSTVGERSMGDEKPGQSSMVTAVTYMLAE